MTTIEGILVLNSGDGSLIYDNEVKKHYGLKAALGGNELQLCAMLYTLFISSTSVNEESGEATSSRSTAHIDGETVNDYSLHWIKSGDSVLYFMKQGSVLVVTINSVVPTADVQLSASEEDTLSSMSFGEALSQMHAQVVAIHKIYFSIINDLNYKNMREYMRLNKMKIDLLKNTMNTKLKAAGYIKTNERGDKDKGDEALLSSQAVAVAVAGGCGFGTDGTISTVASRQSNVICTVSDPMFPVNLSVVSSHTSSSGSETVDKPGAKHQSNAQDIVPITIDTPRYPETRDADTTSSAAVVTSTVNAPEKADTEIMVGPTSWWCCG